MFLDIYIYMGEKKSKYFIVSGCGQEFFVTARTHY